MAEVQQVIYSMVRVGKVVPPNKQILRDITLGFYYGAKIGVLGLNGAGKSTLLKIMSGVDDDHLGETMLSKGYTRGMMTQEPVLDDTKTVKEVVQEAVAPLVQLQAKFDEVSAKFAEPDADFDKLMEEQGKLQEQMDKHDVWTLDSRLELAMDALRCPPGDSPVTNLSGGERRRVALCRLLLTEPDILDAESVAWLERHLRDYKGTVIAVTHDRYFLDNAAEWILELDRGFGIPYKGNYSSWLEQKSERVRLEEKGEDKRQKTLSRELEWIRMSPRARQAKSKARVQAYETLLDQDNEKRREEMEIYIPPGPRLGDVVIEAKNISKSYGDNLLYENLSFSVPPGAIVGIIGPNGVGKTTLFRMITGQEQPDTGTFTVGETVKLGYADQSRTLDADKNVWEEISGGEEWITLGPATTANFRKTNSRAYVAGFNFLGSDQQQKVGSLSGGQRNRVHLAKTLREGANVLLLDEPTNDIDVNTMRALEDAITQFAGTAMIISHDRWFLDRVCTHVLAFEDDGNVRWFVGNVSDYEEDRHKRLGKAADTPHRVTHRKLQR
jgi:energy-dependent translational throttle protein EttA